MKFLNKVIEDLLQNEKDLLGQRIILPGKRPVIFIKKILKEKQYNGFLPEFLTIEDVIVKISGKNLIKGVSLWLLAYEFYRGLYPSESFDSFIKWFPTLVKDWDDMMKFSPSESKVLEDMLDEEQIKNWAENLGENTPRKKYFDFWKKMNVFLPGLKKYLLEKGFATSGMIHQLAKEQIKNYAEQASYRYILVGFNALTPVEEQFFKALLSQDKARCYFHTDSYYMNDEKQESGTFLRKYKNWKEFNEYRPFHWVENDFVKSKKIKLFEASGSVTQNRILPSIFSELEQDEHQENTAVVLLDEHLLPSTLQVLKGVDRVNITMGVGLKNLNFSNIIRYFFHLHKQLGHSSKYYYYKDVFLILEAMPDTPEDKKIKQDFIQELKKQNVVYIPKKLFDEKLKNLSYYSLFQPKENTETLLKDLAQFCFELKFKVEDDIIFENISYFENTFLTLFHLIQSYDFDIKIEALEVLVNQMLNLENIDFVGEPLQGLQVMGLLETRLLNFKNVIMLSVNEGKLPLGNTQNTYIPFDVRKRHNMHTFLENDGIYAYHFYRLLQDSEKVFLIYNGVSSGMNTGEMSRFITQLEIESPHQIEKYVVENLSQPTDNQLITIEKTPRVKELLHDWKKNIAPTHLNDYLVNPLNFYMKNLLKVRETRDIEEELSNVEYGNLVHKALEVLYLPFKGEILKLQDFDSMFSKIDTAIDFAITEKKHQKEFYQKGINYILKVQAQKTIEKIIQVDRDLVEKGNVLKIIELEYRIENVVFKLNDTENVIFNGFIDRIDCLNNEIRIIDYKSKIATTKKLEIKAKNGELPSFTKDYSMAVQLLIYLYYMEEFSAYKGYEMSAGIWDLSKPSFGLHILKFLECDYLSAMQGVREIILEILDENIPFKEAELIKF